MHRRNLLPSSFLKPFWGSLLRPDFFHGLVVVQVVVLVAVLTAGVAISIAQADQSAPELHELYAQLKNAESSFEAAQLESRIWEHWLTAPDDASDSLIRAISTQMSKRNFRDALVLSSELVERYPNYAEGWNKRATIYYLMRNFDASVRDIYQTLQLEPRHFGAIAGLGLIFQHNGKLEAALGAFEQVLHITPQSANAQRNVEQLKSELGDKI